MITSPIRRFFRGATALLAGSRGLVPAPAAGAQDHVLHGDGTFRATTNASAATTAETLAGTNNTKFVTPLGANERAMLGDSSRQAAGYVQSDGAIANRAAGIYGPFDATINRRGWLPGTAALELLIWVDVPSANPSGSNANLWAATSDATGGIAIAWAMGLSIFNGTADLVIYQNGATPASDLRRATVTNFRSTYSGQRVPLRVRFTRGSTAPRIWAFSTELTPTLSDGAGSDPDWLSPSMASTWHVTGLNWPSGLAPQVTPIIGTLTDAEAGAWRITGNLPAWVAAGGSTQLLTANSASFESNVGEWAQAGNHAIARVADGTAPSGSFVAEVMASGAGAWVGNAVWVSAQNYTRVAGGKYRVRFKAKSVSGSTALTIQANFAGARTLTADWAEYVSDVFTPTVPGTLTVALFLSGTGVCRIDNVRIEAEGALTIPVVQPCLVVGDGTQIGDNQGRLLGCLPITDRQTWRIVARTHTSSAENVQAFGGPVLLEANRSRIDSIAALQNSGGALNLSIGSASDGADLVASTSIPSGNAPTDLTLALRYPPTQNLWLRRVAGAGTAPFTVTLEGHRIAGNP